VPGEAKKNITVEKTYELVEKSKSSPGAAFQMHTKEESAYLIRGIFHPRNEQEKKSELCLSRNMEYEDTYLSKKKNRCLSLSRTVYMSYVNRYL
jgi:hypothetical protein